MLVTQCCAGCRVAEPAHELGQRRARLSSQNGTRVSQIMPAQIRATGLVASRVERLVERGRGQSATVCGGEEQPFLASGDVLAQVVPQHRDQVRRDGHVADAGL
jgi:hypothetical protein